MPLTSPTGAENASTATFDEHPPSGSDSSTLGTAGLWVASSTSGQPDDELLDLYYDGFHRAHPCALPLCFMKQKINDRTPGIELLVAVINFIGSLFSSKYDTDLFEQQVKALLPQQPLVTGYEIQALLMYSIALYWCNDVSTSRELLNDATGKAILIGMHLREFADMESLEDPILAESWRRTWWGLYLTDLHMTATSHDGFLRTSQMYLTTTTDFPCSEAEYAAGVRILRSL